MKQGDDPSGDVGARQRRQHQAPEASGRRAHELDFRQGVAVEVKSRLEKGDTPPGRTTAAARRIIVAGSR